jgi:hypothetical protein
MLYTSSYVRLNYIQQEVHISVQVKTINDVQRPDGCYSEGLLEHRPSGSRPDLILLVLQGGKT